MQLVYWEGSIVAFEFASTQFGFASMAANTNKLVNVHPLLAAELTQYIASQAVPRVQVQIARPAAVAVPQLAAPKVDDDVLTELLNRLEACRGPAARRALVASAEKAFSQRHMYERFLLEATRVEVAAVLEKVDGLKTPAAKLRHLRECVEAIRNDPVPDDLQRNELEKLEAEIRSIEG